MLSEQVRRLGQRVRCYEYPLNPSDQPKQSLVIFRCKPPQPAMLGDQISTDTTYNEEYQQVGIEEESGRRHQFTAHQSAAGP